MTERQAFLEARRKYLGGTDVAAICGLSNFGSRLSVYLSKVGKSPEGHESLAMRRGTFMEPFIIEEFERQHPDLMVINRQQSIVREDWGFPAGASVDGLVAHRSDPDTPIGIFESKTAYGWTSRDWDEKTGDVPDSYFTQGVWYLAVTGLPIIYVVADTGDPEKLTVVPFRQDKKLEVIQKSLIKHGCAFWHDHVLADVCPPPNGTEREGEVIQGLFERSAPTTVELTGESRLIRAYLAAHEVEKEATQRKDRIKQELQMLIGEAEQAIVDGLWRYTWKPSTRRSVYMDRLVVEFPEVAAAVISTTTSRRFGAPKEIKA